MTYNELTRRYFDSPSNSGILSGAGVFRGAAGNREYGTWVQFDAQVVSGTLQAVRFLAFACPHTIAVAAFVAEQALGMKAAARLPREVRALAERFEVPEEKLGRILIIEDAWAAALTPAIDYDASGAISQQVGPT
jgi:NifU-like protein involved in Fe-S cluster formation